MHTEKYLDQLPTWTTTGKHILAHHDEETIYIPKDKQASLAIGLDK